MLKLGELCNPAKAIEQIADSGIDSFGSEFFGQLHSTKELLELVVI